jgi:hypothetical protein
MRPRIPLGPESIGFLVGKRVVRIVLVVMLVNTTLPAAKSADGFISQKDFLA